MNPILLEPEIEQPQTPVPPPAAATTRKPPLPALTGIRTLLAIFIILFHFTPPHLGFLYPIINNGYVFVGVFFLISGYVLTYNYADRAKTLVKREFWLARFSRLYPVYLLVLLISFRMVQDEWHARSHFEFWQGMIMTPLVLQGWSPSVATFWNTVAWTLSSEVVLYAAFPWLIRLPWPKKPARLILLLIALWIVGLIPHLLYLLLNPDHIVGPVDRYSSTQLIRFLKYTPLPLRLHLPHRCHTRKTPARPDHHPTSTSCTIFCQPRTRRNLLLHSRPSHAIPPDAWRSHDPCLRRPDARPQWSSCDLGGLLMASTIADRRKQLLPLPPPLQCLPINPHLPRTRASAPARFRPVALLWDSHPACSGYLPLCGNPCSSGDS